MSSLFDLKKTRAIALRKAETITNAVESASRQMTEDESREFDVNMVAVTALSTEIAKKERQNTLQSQLVDGMLVPAGGNLRQARTPGAPVVLSESYFNAFHTWVGTRGQQVDAALYEGSGSSGGFIVPVIVEGQVVPLAPNEMGVRTIASVIPTAMDIKVPVAASFGTAALKVESGSSINTFTESDPSLQQFTLSAFMSGITHTISWELAQDVPSFQQFCVTDLILAIQMLEESLYVTGTGTGQAQGLIGNTGAGVTGVAAGSDNYASELMAASFDVQGKLNSVYHPGACWLMARATGTVLRKAQAAANYFAPLWTRENGQDFFHGYPVAYSSYMPSISTGHTPVLFGNFKDGYIIGDRGGSGINVKILDQPLANQGQLMLLGYRRTDGRVRRSEAIQAITLA